MDAPVSGGTAGQRRDTQFYRGRAAEKFEQVKPVLEAMGKISFTLGEGGRSVAKICNNMLLGVIGDRDSRSHEFGRKTD